MRVVYLIQTHTNPEQIYRLVKVIKKSSNDSYIVMSHNFNASQIDVELFESLPNVKVLRAKKVGRGDFSITQAYLDVVDWILTQNIQFDWLANLTGQ
ncbi:MAG TPA: beta-1,6-N-acetylglucosaminyltransferase, partial [Phormidium sp.]